MLDVTSALERLAAMEASALDSEEIKRQLDLDRFELSHLRRLARTLTPATRDVIARARLSFAHARAIARLGDAEQETFARDIAQKRWSARKAEQEAKARLTGSASTSVDDYQALAETIAEQIGHPVAIRADRGNPQRGEITLTFADLACFDAILDRLGVTLPE